MILYHPTIIALAFFGLNVVINPLHQDHTSRFNINNDLILAHFDCKTDVDDLHSVAAFKTLLSTNKFREVQFHAVAGAYGIQEGLYVPANELFDLTFGSQWSDAHTNKQQALTDVSKLALKVLHRGGHIWVAEAGQSDFTADVIRHIQKSDPSINTNEKFHIVQHSEWNQDVTDSTDLAYVRTHGDYHKIPDGNTLNNGTPGFRSEQRVDFMQKLKNPQLRNIWRMAMDIGGQYNGTEERYLNKAIKKGGLDFSDLSETCWILGIEDIKDADDFFNYCQEN